MKPQSVEYRLPGANLHGIRIGQGPLALFFHGITANAYVFLPVLEVLSLRFCCISIDQRGHGRSDKPQRGYSANDFASDIAALIRFVNSGPALLVGHSLGARNALVAADQNPELTTGVVAIEFTPFIEEQVFDELDLRVAGGNRVFPDPDAIELYVSERYPRMPREAVTRRARYGYVAVSGGWRPLADPNAMAQTAHGLREDLAPALRGINVPALLIRGAESELVSASAWEQTRALRPDIEALELADADHYVPEEVPQATADAIAAFWNTIPREAQ